MIGKDRIMVDNIVYKNKTTRAKREHLAIFDVDWTLIKPKDGKRFPKDKTDWQWLRESVPKTIQKYYRNKYLIVFLTDQTKPWKVDMIKDVIDELDIPVTALIAMNKEFHKPNSAFFMKHFEGKYDKANSFYVGDAAGREGDWADKDKVVAAKIGVQFYTPEEVFPLEKQKMNEEQEKSLAHTEKEVVIMVGYPGSGKSTIVKTMLETNNYVRIDGDLLKTPERMIREAEKHIATNSVVFDATNGTNKGSSYILSRFCKKT
jgi:bifunctional polynucleotide phosphatase/kinase